MSPVDRRHKILIASHLERELVERIAGVDERLDVLWAPELLPVPRYAADHIGQPRSLSDTDLHRWRSLLAEADISFDFDWWQPASMPQNAPRLQWVQATSSGIGEMVRSNGLADTDLTLTTAAGVHCDPLGEFVLFGLLWLAKDIPQLLDWQRQHRWQRHTSRQLAGQRVLIIGAGSVGRRVAELCAAAHMEVWVAVRPGRNRDIPGVRRCISVDEVTGVLSEVDALVLACPLTDDTFHLIGPKQLAALPAHAVLVNVARGQVVDEVALVEALSAGRLAGAALDVFEQEPLPTSSPLWDMPNVFVSPHSASTVADENVRIVDLFVDNLRLFLDGQPLRNEYSRARAY